MKVERPFTVFVDGIVGRPLLEDGSYGPEETECGGIQTEAIGPASAALKVAHGGRVIEVVEGHVLNTLCIHRPVTADDEELLAMVAEEQAE